MLAKYKYVIFLLYLRFIICIAFILCFLATTTAQDFVFSSNRKKQSIHFKFIKNLIVIPVYINKKGPFDFILDTGVGPIIITDASILDSLNFKKMRKIAVRGLGKQEVDAYISLTLNAKIGRAEMRNMPIAILKEDMFNLSGYLGTKIYGLIGYNFFNSFIVAISYSNKTLKFYEPKEKVKYKGQKIPITIQNFKPYINIQVQLDDGQYVKSKILMDTGASHALSLENLNNNPFPLPLKFINSNLGMSLSGQISGHLGRIKTLEIGNYNFKNVIAGFPDFKFINDRVIDNRNGNIGADLLKRFNIIFNYKLGFIYLKPSIYFKNPFEHDMVGIVVYLNKGNYDRKFIGDIDKDSPAEKAGLLIDDEILAINFKSIENYSLGDLDNLFKSKQYKTLIFEIFRNNQKLFKVVKLQKRI